MSLPDFYNNIKAKRKHDTLTLPSGDMDNDTKAAVSAVLSLFTEKESINLELTEEPAITSEDEVLTITGIYQASGSVSNEFEAITLLENQQLEFSFQELKHLTSEGDRFITCRMRVRNTGLKTDSVLDKLLNTIELDFVELVFASHYIAQKFAIDDKAETKALLKAGVLMDCEKGINIHGDLNLPEQFSFLSDFIGEGLEFRASSEDWLAEEGTVTLTAQRTTPVDIGLFSLPFIGLEVEIGFTRTGTKITREDTTIRLQSKLQAGGSENYGLPIGGEISVTEDKKNVTLTILPAMLANAVTDAKDLIVRTPPDFQTMLTIFSGVGFTLPDMLEVASTIKVELVKVEAEFDETSKKLVVTAVEVLVVQNNEWEIIEGVLSLGEVEISFKYTKNEDDPDANPYEVSIEGKLFIEAHDDRDETTLR